MPRKRGRPKGATVKSVVKVINQNDKESHEESTNFNADSMGMARELENSNLSEASVNSTRDSLSEETSEIKLN